MINILHIHSSLQTAALGMTGIEFNAFTAQARDHLFAGEREQLTQLLAGHRVGTTDQVLRQIVTARALFFGELPCPVYYPDLSERISKSEPTVASLVKIMTDSNMGKYERTDAIGTLGKIGDPQSIEPLLRALEREQDNRDDLVREGIILALAEIGEPAIEPLAGALRNGRYAFIRIAAADALAEIRDPRAVGPLIKAMAKDRSLNVQDAVGDFLEIFANSSGVEPLIDTLRNEDRQVQYAAMRMLVSIGEPAVAALNKALSDEDSSVGKLAARALKKIRSQ